MIKKIKNILHNKENGHGGGGTNSHETNMHPNLELLNSLLSKQNLTHTKMNSGSPVNFIRKSIFFKFPIEFK